jgi:hypothetical protein
LTLHPFFPAQEFAALWQLPLPLHEFTPSQWTLAESAALARRGAPALNSPAATAAMSAPLVLM